jgi:hypothetical protein
MTFEQALIAAVITLSGAIAIVYADLRKRIDVCEADRRQLWDIIRKHFPQTDP